jgi:hypothetical protein
MQHFRKDIPPVSVWLVWGVVRVMPPGGGHHNLAVGVGYDESESGDKLGVQTKTPLVQVHPLVVVRRRWVHAVQNAIDVQEQNLHVVSLSLNDNALPEIDEAVIAEETKPAMEVTDDITAVTLKTTNPKLYYGLVSADAPNSDDLNPASAGFTVPALTQGTGSAMQITIPVAPNESSKFYKVYVTDIAPAQSGN